MANKNDTTQFLKRELRTLAQDKGLNVIPAQANINNAAANRAAAQAIRVSKQRNNPVPNNNTP